MQGKLDAYVVGRYGRDQRGGYRLDRAAAGAVGTMAGFGFGRWSLRRRCLQGCLEVVAVVGVGSVDWDVWATGV